MRRHRLATWRGKALGTTILTLVLSAGTAWGYFFDERREMSLSGFAYTRGTWALSEDDIGTYKGHWQDGNLVQHRNFLTLEWRHNINRLSREMPVTSLAAQFLNLDAFDYYLNMRFEYDSVWKYGSKATDTQRSGGENHNQKNFGRISENYPGEWGFYEQFGFESSRRRVKEALYQLRLFEAYVNITKGPLFIRIGRQNLSWGEADVFRLLDQINPLDNNFGGFTTALDERRIPLDMIRAQWSFGTVGPVSDLTLEGFFSNDQETAARTTLQGCFFCIGTITAPIMINRTPCGDPFFRSKDTPAKGKGLRCSTRANGPHSSIKDVRGGGRILGTVHDFTFSVAHYYTWADQTFVRATAISPTPQHALWDLNGLGNPALVPATNPWGANDPTVGLNGPGTPGAFLTFGGDGTPASIERNLRSAVNSKRIQVTGASLSFPVNALTGMFVGSDNPLYYIYTTFRGEAAFFQNVPVARANHDLSAGVTFQRFLTPTVAASGIPINQIPLAGALGFNSAFLPGGAFSSEAGSRAGHTNSRDFYAWNVGLDHNQWIRFLNPSNSFTFSGQFFWARGLGVNKRYEQGVPVGLLNDKHALPVTNRFAAPAPGVTRVGGPGNRAGACTNGPGKPANTPPCDFQRLLGFPVETQVFTLAVSTPYMGGNLTPNLAFIYDLGGAWLVQPGVNWTFWDPWRMQIRYNWIDGRYTGVGLFKTKDSVWLELQYLLY
jgi:hypothetical protein